MAWSPHESLIAQAASDRKSLEGLAWLALIVLVSVTAIVVLSFVKKMRDAAVRRKVPPFTLEDLRRLRDGNRITHAEFDALKEHVLGEMGD